MKKLAYFFAGTVLILFSCSTDGDIYDHHTDMPNSLQKGPSTAPGNSDNTFDHIGRSYREALDQYLKSGSATESLEQGIRNLLSVRTGQLWKRTITSAYQSSENGTVVIDSLQTLETIITDSDLTPEAQTSLLDLIENVLALQEDGYDVLYDHIIAYEARVTEHPAFTVRDKQVILTFSSLVRHATYPGTTPMTEGEEEEDEDWDLSVGNVIDFVLMALEDAEEGASGTMIPYLGKGSQK